MIRHAYNQDVHVIYMLLQKIRLKIL